MGRVGKAYGIGSRLQADSLRQLELTCEAQVHVEEAGTAELITVRVSIMCIGITGYHRRSERSGIEEVTAKVCGRAGLSRTKRLPTDLVVGSDEISRLDRSICVQRARRTGHGEGRTGHIADHCTHLPSPEDLVTYSGGHPSLPFTERQLKDAVDFEILTAIKTGRSVVLLPVGWVWETERVESPRWIRNRAPSTTSRQSQSLIRC